MLFIEDDALGVNEHTMCDWEVRPSAARHLATPLNCREWRFDGTDWIAVNPRQEFVTLRLLDDDSLRMQFHGNEAAVMERCDD